jgi:hypothetical protein
VCVACQILLARNMLLCALSRSYLNSNKFHSLDDVERWINSINVTYRIQKYFLIINHDSHLMIIVK